MNAPEPTTVSRLPRFLRARKVCFVCGTIRNVGPHHVIPRSEGGLPIFDNIVWLCKAHHDEVEGPGQGAWERIYAARARSRGQTRSAGSAERAEMCLSWYKSRPVAEQECDETTEAIADPNEIATEGAAIGVKRIWEGGPLRQWSEKRATSRWIRHAEGWAGMYVCEDCRESAPMGVYSTRLGHDSRRLETILWLCGTCRDARRGRGEQPTGLRAYFARKREETLVDTP